MIVTEMNVGQKTDYALRRTKLDFGDGALTVDLARWQKDYTVTKDIMADREGDLGIGSGAFYVAQVEIPPIEYEEQTETVTDGEGNESENVVLTPLPLDTDKVELRLFSIEGIKIN